MQCPECGLCYGEGYPPDERYHRRFHDEALHGPVTKLCDGFFHFNQQSLMQDQKLAATAARHARRDTGYDIPCFEAVKKKHDEHSTIATLCVKGGRICGLIVSRERACGCASDLDSFEPDDLKLWRPTSGKEFAAHIRRAIDMIWVLKERRRQGVATGLIHALTEKCGVKLGDLAHMVPLQEDALRLWKALRLSTVYLV